MLNSFKKLIRFYYWLVFEFFKKYLRLILLSFFVSFLVIVGFLSVSPYLKVILTQRNMIGYVGNYDFNNLPDEVLSKISNGLVVVNEKGEIIPLLANSWEVKDDGKRYRFHLKNNLLWNDNKNFVASDINYRFNDVEIKPVDDYTVDFNLKKPLGVFPVYLNRPLLRYPLIGIAGFYRVGKIRSKEGSITELNLVPNTKNLNPIIYRFYTSDSDMVSAYKKGEINQMTVNKKTIADSFSNWKNSQITRTVDYSKLLTIFFNEQTKILTEKDIRQAFPMMFDYKKLSGFGEVALGSIPPISWAYNPNLKTNSYDIDTASKIIKNGITSSDSASLDLVTYYDYYDIADSLISEIEASGLKVNLKIISEPPEKFDLLLAYLKIPTDPDQYYYWHSTQKQGNISNYNNVKIDKLLEDGRKTIDIQEREKIYLDFQKTLQDDPPGVFLYYPYVYTIKRK